MGSTESWMALLVFLVLVLQSSTETHSPAPFAWFHQLDSDWQVRKSQKQPFQPPHYFSVKLLLWNVSFLLWGLWEGVFPHHAVLGVCTFLHTWFKVMDNLKNGLEVYFSLKQLLINKVLFCQVI